MIDEQIEQFQNQISSLRKEREVTKDSISFIKRDIVIKTESKGEQEINASRK